MSLPAWAESIRPVDMAGAAELLGIARRTLVDVLRDHPHYESRGVKKVFYPEHIEALALLIATSPPTNANEALRRAIMTRMPASMISQAGEFLDRDVSGKVYFIRCHDRVKIGFAADFSQRFRVLKTSCPYPVTVIAVIDGDRDLELFLHRCFAQHRRHGEWFEENGDLKAIVADLEAFAI